MGINMSFRNNLKGFVKRKKNSTLKAIDQYALSWIRHRQDVANAMRKRFLKDGKIIYDEGGYYCECCDGGYSLSSCLPNSPLCSHIIKKEKENKSLHPTLYSNQNKNMSERKLIQNELIDWLLTWTSAPYGVIGSIDSFGKGKVRKIAFGIARYLDAELIIISKNRLILNSNIENIEFNSIDEFKKYCNKYTGKKICKLTMLIS